MSKAAMSDERYVISFEELRMTDVEQVGGKNASLGEMITQLSSAGVRVPGGFATTAAAFRDFLNESGLTEKIDESLTALDIEDLEALTETGKRIRQWITDAPLTPRLQKDIGAAYASLVDDGEDDASFAVRSSATAEDLPDASFAGQQESYRLLRCTTIGPFRIACTRGSSTRTSRSRPACSAWFARTSVHPV
jgi:pyruvate,water dikinase